MLFYETMDKNKLPPSSTLAFQDPRGQILGDIMRYVVFMKIIRFM